MPYTEAAACGNCHFLRDEHCQKCHSCPGGVNNACCGTPEGAGPWLDVPVVVPLCRALGSYGPGIRGVWFCALPVGHKGDHNRRREAP